MFIPLKGAKQTQATAFRVRLSREHFGVFAFLHAMSWCVSAKMASLGNCYLMSMVTYILFLHFLHKKKIYDRLHRKQTNKISTTCFCLQFKMTYKKNCINQKRLHQTSQSWNIEYLRGERQEILFGFSVVVW